jgi:hypothetical protein
MILYRVSRAEVEGRQGEYFECDACGRRFPDVEVFKTVFGILPQFRENLQKTLEGVFTLFQECTPERYEENGALRWCPYCGAPFYHVVDVYESWQRGYRLPGSESWLTGEEAEAALKTLLGPARADRRERLEKELQALDEKR